MKKNITIKFLIVSIVAVFVSSFVSVLILQSQYEKNLKTQLENTLQMVSLTSDLTQDKQVLAENISKSFSQYRVTILSINGDVVGDSHFSSSLLENHFDRIEIQQALLYNKGFSIRHSVTQNVDVMYSAIKKDNYVIRISVKMKEIQENIQIYIPSLLIGILVGLLFATFFSVKLSSSILTPLSRINQQIQSIENKKYNILIENTNYKELNQIVKNVNKLSENISYNMITLENQNQKLEYLFDTIRQGIVIIDHNKMIVQCNSTAVNIFETTHSVINKSVYNLTRNLKIINAIENCLINKSSDLFDIHTDQKIYTINISYISNEWIHDGLLIIATDLTAEKQFENLRKELIDNISHELKTPLTSISGFAELLQNECIENKKLNDYLTIITQEALFINDMIEKMLKISSLENNLHQKNHFEPLNLEIILQKIFEESQPLLVKKNILLQQEITSPILISDYESMYQILNNLFINAIKYNKINGTINVSVHQNNTHTIIKIEDSGIGISAKDLPRLFERFFRVDKGRSRANGGSGLGLSIVKHALKMIDGSIEVTSKIDVGSKFVIHIPKK